MEEDYVLVVWETSTEVGNGKVCIRGGYKDLILEEKLYYMINEKDI